jgi:hypothetical protein
MTGRRPGRLARERDRQAEHGAEQHLPISGRRPEQRHPNAPRKANVSLPLARATATNLRSHERGSCIPRAVRSPPVTAVHSTGKFQRGAANGRRRRKAVERDRVQQGLGCAGSGLFPRDDKTTESDSMHTLPPGTSLCQPHSALVSRSSIDTYASPQLIRDSLKCSSICN